MTGQNLSSCEFEEWMLRAAWNLEQRQEIIQTAAGEEGLFYLHETQKAARPLTQGFTLQDCQ